MSGWVPIDRSILNSPDWTSERFTKGQARIDLWLLASYKDTFIRISGEKIPIKKGVCAWSVVNLSKRWNWSKQKVINFLDYLENGEGVIKKTATNRTTFIEIIGYENHLKRSQENQTPEWTPECTPECTPEQSPDWTPVFDNNFSVVKEKNNIQENKNQTPECTPEQSPEWTPEQTAEWTHYKKLKNKKNKSLAFTRDAREARLYSKNFPLAFLDDYTLDNGLIDYQKLKNARIKSYKPKNPISFSDKLDQDFTQNPENEILSWLKNAFKMESQSLNQQWVEINIFLTDETDKGVMTKDEREELRKDVYSRLGQGYCEYEEKKMWVDVIKQRKYAVGGKL